MLSQKDVNSAIKLARTAEALEPSRAGYHLLTGQILLRSGDGVDAAIFAKFVAERWLGADHNEAVELWDAVPADQRPFSEPIIRTAPKDTETIEGTVVSVTCNDLNQVTIFVVSHDDHTLKFHGKGDIPFGSSDTIWFGPDHISLCGRLEGMRALVHYKPASNGGYAGNIAEIEIRNDVFMSTVAVTEKAATKATP